MTKNSDSVSPAKPRKYEPGWSGNTRGDFLTGTYTDQDCPREGCPGKIVYNGNYLCEYWAWYSDRKVDYDAGECDYGLPHPQTEYQDRLLSWKLTGAWEEGEVPDPNDRYNTLWIEHKSEPVKPVEKEKAQ